MKALTKFLGIIAIGLFIPIDSKLFNVTLEFSALCTIIALLLLIYVDLIFNDEQK